MAPRVAGAASLPDTPLHELDWEALGAAFPGGVMVAHAETALVPLFGRGTRPPSLPRATRQPRGAMSPRLLMVPWARCCRLSENALAVVPVHIGKDRGQVLSADAAPAACDDRWVADGARGRREAIRQLAGLRRSLAAAEDTLAGALAAMKQAEGAFDAASDHFDAAERALDAAREERAQARRDRYAARQAYEQASAAADRLARRARDLAERLDRPADLVPVSEPG